MKVIILADFIVPKPKGGAGIAILNEARELMELGVNVSIYSRLGYNGNYLGGKKKQNIGELTVYNTNHIYQDYLREINFIILNNISLVEVATKLKKELSIPIIFRRHIDWLKKISISNEIGLKPKDLFKAHKRHSPSKTIKLYRKALKISDFIADVDPKSVSIDDKKYFHIPPRIDPLFQEKKLTHQSFSTLSILIGGRLNDPIKGSERILNSLFIADDFGLSFKIHLIGKAKSEFIRALSNRFKSKFYNHGWVHSTEEKIKVFSMCNIFLTLPYYEPYGLMLKETMTCGLIPLSTNTGLAAKIKSIKPEMPIISNKSEVQNDTLEMLNKLKSLSDSELTRFSNSALSISRDLDKFSNTLYAYLSK